jgi:sec-independent protein translocase protein TatB
MFDVSWGELILVGVVALIVIGPKELPTVLRTAGQWMTKIRRMAAEFQGQFNEAMREAEFAELKQQVDSLAETTRSFANPLETAQKELNAALTSEPSATPSGEPAATSADSVATPSGEPAAAATDSVATPSGEPSAPASPAGEASIPSSALDGAEAVHAPPHGDTPPSAAPLSDAPPVDAPHSEAPQSGPTTPAGADGGRAA